MLRYSMVATVFLLVSTLFTGSLSGSAGTGSDQYDVIPLSTQVPLSFQGWERDSDGDGLDDMLDDTSQLDRMEGRFGINVHMDRPVDSIHVSSLMQKAGSMGMDPIFLRTGRYTTAVYLLVNEPVRGTMDDLMLPNVDFIEYRPMIKPFLDTSSPALRAKGSEKYSPLTAEDLGLTGEGITIAVLDSGVDNNLHESLRGKYEFGVDFTGTNTIAGLDPDDIDGHGTHVAGTALGDGGAQETYTGTAPEASLVDLRIFRSFGSILGNSDQAFEWLIENHEEYEIDIVQCSFGSSVTTSGRDTTAQLANRLVDEGLVVVVAAGNMGTSGLPSPASADKVITVGAYDHRDTVDRSDDTHERYSNRGPRQDDGDLDKYDEMKPDVCAPGTEITAPKHNSVFDYVSLTGTSMACPHVSGITALMLEADPDLSPGDVKQIMRDTSQQDYSASRPIDDDKYNFRSGWGLIDAYGAVKRAVDISDIIIEAPRDVRSGQDLRVTARGSITKTPYDTWSEVFELELRTPYSWGRQRDIVVDPGRAGEHSEYQGPFREGNDWVTTMKALINSSVEEADPSLSVTISPFGEIGDSATLQATSSLNDMGPAVAVREVNITEGPMPADLSVTPLSIWFSDPLPDGGDLVDITVKVNNTGGRSVDQAVVHLLDGPEISGDLIGESTISVPMDSYAITTFTWEANPGIHAITAVVDPDDLVNEANEDNNSAERPITVRGLNPRPIAELAVNPEEGTTNTIFVFDGSSSRDTNLRGGNVVSYKFDFGDGTSSGWVDRSVVEHRYRQGGPFTASLTVKDNGGAESMNDETVTINVTDVSSLDRTLFLNSSSGLSVDPGPTSMTQRFGTSMTGLGVWVTSKSEETIVLHTSATLDMIISCTEATSLDYNVELSVSGGGSISAEGDADLGMGNNTISVEMEPPEMELKADAKLSLSISGKVEQGDSRLVTGDGGSVLEFLYYLPMNELPEVDAGDDREVRVDETVTFRGEALDTDGTIVSMQWDVNGDDVIDHEGSETYQYPGYTEEGTYQAEFRARDDDGGWSADTIKVIVRPKDYNYPPDVVLESPGDVTGFVTIRGTSSDDGIVRKVEVSVRDPGDGTEVLPWTEAEGTEEWSLGWDSRGVEDGEYVILARSFDGSLYSDTESCNITVSNPNTPPLIQNVTLDPDTFVAGYPTMMMMEIDVDDPDLPADSLEATVDLTSIGGPADLEMNDEGFGADTDEGDGIYSGGFTPSKTLEVGVHVIYFIVTDSAGEADSISEEVTVIAEIDADISADPRDVESGEDVLLEVKVDSPVDIDISTRSDLFSGTLYLADNGTSGDRIAGDRIFTIILKVEGDPGTHTILVDIEDRDGNLLLSREVTIRIVGASGEIQAEGGEIPPVMIVAVLLSGLIIIGSLFLVYIVRRREDRSYNSQLPVHGEMP